MTEQELIAQLLDDDESPLDRTHVRRAVCPQCQGEGTSSAYLGAFTGSEMAELGEEFFVDYMSGFYDRTCTHCGGLRVVWELTEDAPAEALAELDELFETEAMYEAERRAGA